MHYIHSLNYEILSLISKFKEVCMSNEKTYPALVGEEGSIDGDSFAVALHIHLLDMGRKSH